MTLHEQIAALPDPRTLSAAEQAQMEPLNKYLVAFQGNTALLGTIELAEAAIAD